MEQRRFVLLWDFPVIIFKNKQYDQLQIHFNDGVYHQSLSLNWMFILFGFSSSFFFCIKVFKVFCVIRKCAHLFGSWLENLAFFIFFSFKSHLKQLFFRWAYFYYVPIYSNTTKRNFTAHNQTNAQHSKNICAVTWFYFVHFKKMCTSARGIQSFYKWIPFFLLYAKTVEIL